MNIRCVLDQIRKDFEATDTFFLAECLRNYGIHDDEIREMSRPEIIDLLMSIEERAAFF